jgi:hypothetical protein
MAEEAGCIDFYNYVYTPFSACAHSMWHHIARYDLRECGNPLHRHHRRPGAGGQPLPLPISSRGTCRPVPRVPALNGAAAVPTMCTRP